MKDYMTNFFTYLGCTLQQEGNVLVVQLTPELTAYFGKAELRLVFSTEHLKDNTELVTYGSYLANRVYDLIKHSGEKLSITLPKKESRAALCGGIEIVPYHCSIKSQRSREVHKSEAFMTFRVTYYSNEKFEELVTTKVDVEGNVLANTTFPYTLAGLKQAEQSRFPFTRKQAKDLYARCLAQINSAARQKAFALQEKLAEHYHQDVMRLEGYYQQMIDEIPDLAKNRGSAVHQLQHEYEIKTAEELKKCHVQVTIEPLNFCTVTIPFQRYRYTLETDRNNGKQNRTTIETFHNLFSDAVLYPRCESCQQEMTVVGMCELKSHPVCQECLVECHECKTSICRACGIEKCAECGAWVCPQCSERCHLCGKCYCAEHLLGCLQCRSHFCQHCARQCGHCGKMVGKIHVTECDLSHQQVCLDCIVLCSCCDQKVSQAYIKTCTFCGQQACSECTFRCNVCGKIFCVHHVTECEISDKIVCPQHVGTCESCARQVSTLHLHNCDVCGENICTHCAVQCQGCHIYFCKEDAAEIMKCPECGHMYCSLCYSGQGICLACQKSVQKF